MKMRLTYITGKDMYTYHIYILRENIKLRVSSAAIKISGLYIDQGIRSPQR